MRDEITYPFLNFNDAAFEVSEWISNFESIWKKYIKRKDSNAIYIFSQ